MSIEFNLNEELLRNIVFIINKVLKKCLLFENLNIDYGFKLQISEYEFRFRF